MAQPPLEGVIMESVETQGAEGTAAAQPAPFEISRDLMDKGREAIVAQASDPQWQRAATLPQDWAYALGDGVTTRQVSFYVDGGTRLYGKLFLPKEFDSKGSHPAVVVGHGFNAVSIGIEKYAARFAERGIPAMAIDYQSYGFSDSGSDELLLQTADTSTDADVVVQRKAPVKIKRTNLNNLHQVQDFRAAVSFLQGEPGIDPERIGTWGTSNGGAISHQLITEDARVKAAVMHVSVVRPGFVRTLTRSGPVLDIPVRPIDLAGPALEDAIQRVTTGQGGEMDTGASFQTKIDSFSMIRNQDMAFPAQLDRVRSTTAILYLTAEFDGVPGNNSGAAAVAFFRARGVPAQDIIFPGLSHFQPYSGPAFEVGSNLAADWYLKHLGDGRSA
jgi:uncharacterized protein